MDIHGIPPRGHSPQGHHADQMILKENRAYIEGLESRPHYQEVIRNVPLDGKKEDLSDLIALFKTDATPIPSKMKIAIEGAFVARVAVPGVKHAGQAHKAAAHAPRTQKQQVEHLSQKTEVTDREQKEQILEALQGLPGGSRYRERNPNDFSIKSELDGRGDLRITIRDKREHGVRGILSIKEIAGVQIQDLSYRSKKPPSR